MKDAHFAVTFRRELRKDLEKEKESKYDLELLAAQIFGALIEWITNVLAIKMLFWPENQ